MHFDALRALFDEIRHKWLKGARDGEKILNLFHLIDDDHDFEIQRC